MKIYFEILYKRFVSNISSLVKDSGTNQAGREVAERQQRGSGGATTGLFDLVIPPNWLFKQTSISFPLIACNCNKHFLGALRVIVISVLEGSLDWIPTRDFFPKEIEPKAKVPLERAT